MSKKFNLDSYLEGEKDTAPEVVHKKLQYVIMPEPVQKAIGLPGFPLGYGSCIYGLSDCGKTGLMLNAVAQAQKQGILPIVIITENKLSLERIQKSGIDPKQAIIRQDLKCLEDIYDYISMKVQDVLDGKLQMDVMIFWDSVAGAPSKDSFELTPEGKINKKFDNRKNANVIGYYNSIIANRISETRKVDCPYTLGLVMVTQAYIGEKGPNPALPAPLIPNGGEKIWFPLGLTLEIKEGMRFSTLHKGRKLEYGLVSRIKVKKNHLTELNCDGEIALLGTDILPNDKKVIDEYKSNSKEKWNALLEAALLESE